MMSIRIKVNILYRRDIVHCIWLDGYATITITMACPTNTVFKTIGFIYRLLYFANSNFVYQIF